MGRSAQQAGAPGGAPGHSEQHDAAGRLDPLHRRCMETLARLKPAELQQRMAFIGRATADLGSHVDRLRESPDEAGGFSMDLYPRILRPAEWETIRAGVLQRAAAFSAYVRDVYQHREILHAGVLPAEVVFEDPAFHPELHGLPLDDGPVVTIGAVDLVRTLSGEWQVLENRFSTPTGISHVIQIRRILAQAVPELFEQLPVFPVAAFATRLSEALSGQAAPPAGQQPLVVLLSEGESGLHFFEESFLARHMGIPLARTGDIVVRDSRVFLKTIRGLMRIDVIYRRLEPPQLDPVAFATGNDSGVPGLIQCVRRGTVKVVNALGCGVADNRALLPYSDKLIRHYTGEAPVLRTVASYHGYDRDQADWISEHQDQLMLKTVCHPQTLGLANPEAAQLFMKGELGQILRRDPRLVVAQKLPELSRLPVYRNGGHTLEGMSMRAYFIGGRTPYVLPGGLTRIVHPGHERQPGGRTFHFLKDTWALREHQAARPRSGRLEPEISIPESPLTSRAAEAFYWMGRYLERARATARMLNTLEELRWGELAPGERALYAPLLDAIMEATSQKLPARKRSGDLAHIIQPLLFDPANPASVRSCLALVRYNASSIRSFVTPEFWNSIQGGNAVLAGPANRPPAGTALRDVMEAAVRACDQIYGTAHRTLLHDAGWHFLNTGLLLERSVNHVTILAQVMPRIAQRQWEHLRDDTDLTALLRLLGALDAYHRRYRSRAYLDRVAQLLWQTPSCTGSVIHAVLEIQAALQAVVPESGGRAKAAALGAMLQEFADWLTGLRLEQIFPARALELDRGLTRRNAVSAESIGRAEACLRHMCETMEGLHARLEDVFFSHHPDQQGGTP